MSKTPQDAIELLDADHRCAKALFDEFAQLSRHKPGGGKRKALAEKICMELSEAMGDDDLLDEAEVEHAGAKDLIAQILAMKPGDALYDAKVTVLGDYIAHHVRQEGEEMFPRVRKSGIDLAALGQKLRERKLELQAVPEALREDALASVSA
jgi:hypothetical protein